MATFTQMGSNFWSLLKRTIGGTYISVEPFHLFRYLDEQAFRFNNQKVTDSERFVEVLSMVVGKRLQFAELTGKEPAGYERPAKTQYKAPRRGKKQKAG